MSNSLKLGIGGAIILLLTTSLYAIYAQGQEVEAPTAEITIEDLGVETVGLLPTNPFYFMKEWGRGLKRLLALNAVQRAQLELNVVNEKAAEIKKLEQINAENVRALRRALDNYSEATEGLIARLRAIETDGRNTTARDALLDQLIDRMVTHQQLFDNLRQNTELRADARLARAQERVANAFALGPTHLESPAAFGARAARVIAAKEDASALRVAEALDRLAEELSGDAKGAVLKIKEDLLLQVGGHLEAGEDIMLFQTVSGDALRRIGILDEIRDLVGTQELRTQLGVLRQELLETERGGAGITLEDARAAIERAENALRDLDAMIGAVEGAVPQAVLSLRARAEFTLTQAETLFDQNNYGGSFGQAIASTAASQNALSQLAYTANDFQNELSVLKTELDALIKTARDKKLSETNERLARAITEAERQVAQLSDAITNARPTSTIIPLLRSTKLLVGMIEELIQNELGADSQ